MYRVLLVDDDPHILTTNAAYLKKQGYQIYQAENGTNALKIASSAAVDAVVLDVDMPDMDGIRVCHRLREVSQVPIIFLSAYSTRTASWPSPAAETTALLTGSSLFSTKSRQMGSSTSLRITRRISLAPFW